MSKADIQKRGGGRKPIGTQAMTASERQTRERERNRRQAMVIDVLPILAEMLAHDVSKIASGEKWQLEELIDCYVERIAFLTTFAKVGVEHDDEKITISNIFLEAAGAAGKELALPYCPECGVSLFNKVLTCNCAD